MTDEKGYCLVCYKNYKDKLQWHLAPKTRPCCSKLVEALNELIPDLNVFYCYALERTALTVDFIMT